MNEQYRMYKKAWLLDVLGNKDNPSPAGAPDVGEPESWDPNTIDFRGTEFALNTDKIEGTIKETLTKHYAKLLAKAFKASTGKALDTPEKYIDPRFNFIIGRAANVKPSIYKKLNDFYRDRLGGWSSTGQGVDAGLAMDAVDFSNRHEALKPLDYTTPGFSPDKEYENPMIAAQFI